MSYLLEDRSYILIAALIVLSATVCGIVLGYVVARHDNKRN